MYAHLKNNFSIISRVTSGFLKDMCLKHIKSIFWRNLEAHSNTFLIAVILWDTKFPATTVRVRLFLEPQHTTWCFPYDVFSQIWFTTSVRKVYVCLFYLYKQKFRGSINQLDLVPIFYSTYSAIKSTIGDQESPFLSLWLLNYNLYLQHHWELTMIPWD